MVNDDIVKSCFDQLEKQLREADDDIAILAGKPALEKARLRRRRNALNAACNALHRFCRA